jgi:hypothetical protein
MTKGHICHSLRYWPPTDTYDYGKHVMHLYSISVHVGQPILIYFIHIKVSIMDCTVNQCSFVSRYPFFLTYGLVASCYTHQIFIYKLPSLAIFVILHM